MNSILKEIERTYPDKIIILITHNLHDLSGMDRILFLENGRILEEGTEKELLSQQGQYYQMWRMDNTKEEVADEGL